MTWAVPPHSNEMASSYRCRLIAIAFIRELKSEGIHVALILHIQTVRPRFSLFHWPKSLCKNFRAPPGRWNQRTLEAASIAISADYGATSGCQKLRRTVFAGFPPANGFKAANEIIAEAPFFSPSPLPAFPSDTCSAKPARLRLARV